MPALPYRRSWGYAPGRSLTYHQEQTLNHRLEKYHNVQHVNFVDELEVTQAILSRAVPFSELTVEEANRINAHLDVRIVLHTYFADLMPDPPADFAHEIDVLWTNRRVTNRVVARAGWDTAEYFFSPHPKVREVT